MLGMLPAMDESENDYAYRLKHPQHPQHPQHTRWELLLELGAPQHDA